MCVRVCLSIYLLFLSKSPSTSLYLSQCSSLSASLHNKEPASPFIDIYVFVSHECAHLLPGFTSAGDKSELISLAAKVKQKIDK